MLSEVNIALNSGLCVEAEVVTVFEVVIDGVERSTVDEGVHKIVVEVEVTDVVDDAVGNAGTRRIRFVSAFFYTESEEFEGIGSILPLELRSCIYLRTEIHPQIRILEKKLTFISEMIPLLFSTRNQWNNSATNVLLVMIVLSY